jgi:glycyl-tRNA synthetase alpha chain
VTLQDLVFKLSEYWSSQGCLIQQPLDLEVGAGTMSPETFLRVLGASHWNVAYVQPSRRPADGRFGENPNRLFKHHQFQVILKPSPDEVQHLYLQSLEACGIAIESHDIRFEEDNWESPTLYFQLAGGQELSPISVELTYGLERLAMVLQKVDNVYDLEWGDGVKYRDVRLRDEIEQSKYAFGQVGLPEGVFAAFHRDLFEKHFDFGLKLVESGLVIPALEQCLKCSHLFNVLDASGGVGVTERTAYILRVRQLAVAIAKAYTESSAPVAAGA